jgi:hypothetical protein
MMLEIKHKDERLNEELDEVFKRAKEKSIGCDSILVIMQAKDGRLIYEANPSMRLDTLSFMATSFLVNLHTEIRKP